MTKIGLIKFITLIFISTAALGQKVKYKDLFGLLSTKQYEPAEPFLKKYLKDNDDNPNAFMFMGIIFDEKSSKIDILKQTSLATAYMDSAIIFYDRAHKTIDEREVKKNKEYYQAYNRRDLRTGEFGVKLSDIQFDLEKKMESLKERITKVKMVKFYFALADSLYKKSVSLFTSMQQEFPSERQLYLRAEENTLKKLSSLSLRFDSCMKAFDQYKNSSGTMGRTGYNQTLSLVSIQDFKGEGSSKADFYQNDIKVWDYKKFADHAKEVIEKEIIPMRAHLITYDIEINKLRERLNTDSVSVKNDLTKLIDILLYEQLKKYDPAPLPMEIFSMKTADLEYRSTLLEHAPHADTSDIHLRLAMLKMEMKYLNKLDSISGKLASSDIDQKAIDYGYFVTNTFSNTIVLHSYIQALKEYAVREKRMKDAALTLNMKALNWIIDGVDSIPLTVGQATPKYKPLITVMEKYTTGLTYKDSLNVSGYFYAITPSRKPELKINFVVDKANFKEARLPAIKSMAYSDPADQIYYVLIYSERPVKEKYVATVAKIYRSDGLAWNNNYTLGFLPSEMTFKPETGELTIKNDAKQTVVDKNGKVKP